MKNTGSHRSFYEEQISFKNLFNLMVIKIIFFGGRVNISGNHRLGYTVVSRNKLRHLLLTFNDLDKKLWTF